MSHLGMGVILRELFGSDTAKDPKDYIGQRITAATMAGDALRLVLESGKTIKIWDNGQSSCERRYMTTDDKPEDLVGHRLSAIDVKEGPTIDDEYGEPHETVFIEVRADSETVTLVNHNEHNGYYGGFSLEVSEE